MEKETEMKTRISIVGAVLALALAVVPAWAAETALEGTVSGYTCVILGKACPVDKEDPIVALERVFVVVKADGSYYQAPNIDRAVLARYITEKVRVTGTVNETYKAVQATKLEMYAKDSRRAPAQDPTKTSPLMSKDGWKTVWSLEMEEEARKMLQMGQ